jgi:hypothetical protein
VLRRGQTLSHSISNKSKSPDRRGKPCSLTYNNPRGGFDALSIADGLNPFLPTPVPYKPPTNWTPIITTALAVLLTAVGAKFVIPLLLNKWFWAILSIATILVMTSGFMFVRIRGVPYITVDQQSGRTRWVAGGAQNQYGMETQVVAGICMLFIIATESLNSHCCYRWPIVVLLYISDHASPPNPEQNSPDSGHLYMEWHYGVGPCRADGSLQAKESL